MRIQSVIASFVRRLRSWRALYGITRQEATVRETEVAWVKQSLIKMALPMLRRCVGQGLGFSLTWKIMQVHQNAEKVKQKCLIFFFYRTMQNGLQICQFSRLNKNAFFFIRMQNDLQFFDSAVDNCLWYSDNENNAWMFSSSHLHTSHPCSDQGIAM